MGGYPQEKEGTQEEIAAKPPQLLLQPGRPAAASNYSDARAAITVREAGTASLFHLRVVEESWWSPQPVATVSVAEILAAILALRRQGKLTQEGKPTDNNLSIITLSC